MRPTKLYTQLVTNCTECPNGRDHGMGTVICGKFDRYVGEYVCSDPVPTWCPLNDAEVKV